MNTRQLWIFGLTALGLALTAPVHAAPDLMDGAFIVAKRDSGDEARPAQRDARKDEYPEGQKRRTTKPEAEPEEPQGYGYGYERRRQKQPQQPEDGSRPRDRR